MLIQIIKKNPLIFTLVLIQGVKLIYASTSSLSASAYGEIFNYIFAYRNLNSLLLNIVKNGCGKSECVCKIIFTCAGASWSTRTNKSCEVPRSCMMPSGCSEENSRKKPEHVEMTSACTSRDWARAASTGTPGIKVPKLNTNEDICLQWPLRKVLNLS